MTAGLYDVCDWLGQVSTSSDVDRPIPVGTALSTDLLFVDSRLAGRDFVDFGGLLTTNPETFSYGNLLLTGTACCSSSCPSPGTSWTIKFEQSPTTSSCGNTDQGNMGAEILNDSLEINVFSPASANPHVLAYAFDSGTAADGLPANRVRPWMTIQFRVKIHWALADGAASGETYHVGVVFDAVPGQQDTGVFVGLKTRGTNSPSPFINRLEASDCCTDQTETLSAYASTPNTTFTPTADTNEEFWFKVVRQANGITKVKIWLDVGETEDDATVLAFDHTTITPDGSYWTIFAGFGQSSSSGGDGRVIIKDFTFTR